MTLDRDQPAQHIFAQQHFDLAQAGRDRPLLPRRLVPADRHVVVNPLADLVDIARHQIRPPGWVNPVPGHLHQDQRHEERAATFVQRVRDQTFKRRIVGAELFDHSNGLRRLDPRRLRLTFRQIAELLEVQDAANLTAIKALRIVSVQPSE